jgi:hypothetical protein
VKAHVEALRELPVEFAQSNEWLNRLAARVLAQDADGMLAELQNIFTEKKLKAKVTGGNA